MTSPLTPRYEHTLTCGHKSVTTTLHSSAACGYCREIRDVATVARFHVDADGYRRGPREVVA